MTMVRQRDDSWQRNKPGLGIWPGRGKVAVVGWGQSYIDRRWDGVDLNKTCGAKSMQAIHRALDDAGLTPDDVDGLFSCEAAATRAEQTWAPRPYFAPPYDSEDGLLMASTDWMRKQMEFKNTKYTDSNAGAIWSMMNIAAQAVADGRCTTALVWYPMCNLVGRYGQNNPVNFAEEARGPSAFTLPWGYQSGAMFNNLIAFQQYCKKYGTNHDGLGAFCLNQRRNGLMTPWSYYALHEPYQLTIEDYKNGRLVEEPLVIYDCDRPIHTCAAFIFTTADRAKDLRQKPVYVLNQCSTATDPRGIMVSHQRGTMFTLEEQQQSCAELAQLMWEGSGLHSWDVDIYSPYDGYLTFVQQYLEAFRWQGIGLGEAHDFYKSDIRVEGPHPFMSSGGNNGTGRNRATHYSDCIEQIRGTAGKRQIRGEVDVALAGFDDMMMFGKYPS